MTLLLSMSQNYILRLSPMENETLLIKNLNLKFYGIGKR